MRSKASAAATLPIRRGLPLAEAAIYIGVGSTKFLALVADGRMPKPKLLDGQKLWDVAALDAAFRDLPSEAVKDTWESL